MMHGTEEIPPRTVPLSPSTSSSEAMSPPSSEEQEQQQPEPHIQGPSSNTGESRFQFPILRLSIHPPDRSSNNNNNNMNNLNTELRSCWSTRRACIVAWTSLLIWMVFFWYLSVSVLLVLFLSLATIKWLSVRRAQQYRSLRRGGVESHIQHTQEEDLEEGRTSLEENNNNGTSPSMTPAETTRPPTQRQAWMTWHDIRRHAQSTTRELSQQQQPQPQVENTRRTSRRRRRRNQESTTPSPNPLDSRSESNSSHTIRLRYGNEFAILDIEELSFQTQLALAILESQRYIIETGGYGRPDDDGEEGMGVSHDIQRRWKHYVFPDRTDFLKPSENSSLPNKEMAEDGTENACSICLCDYEGGESITELPCNHAFHRDCIATWVRSHVRCPLCNCDLDLDTSQGEHHPTHGDESST